MQVEGVEQGHADADVTSGGHYRRAHGVGVVVGLAVRAVVDVVELAHHADAREGHLREHRPGQPVVAVGIKPGRDLVHEIAPGPERAPPGMGAAPQGSVKSMAVRVGQGRHRQSSQRNGSLGPGARTGGDGRNATTVNGDQHSRLRPVASQPGQLTPVLCSHDPTLSEAEQLAADQQLHSRGTERGRGPSGP